MGKIERLAIKFPRTGLVRLQEQGFVVIKGRRVIVTREGEMARRRRRWKMKYKNHKYMIKIEPELPDIEERPLDINEIKKQYPKVWTTKLFF